MPKPVQALGAAAGDSRQANDDCGAYLLPALEWWRPMTCTVQASQSRQPRRGQVLWSRPTIFRRSAALCVTQLQLFASFNRRSRQCARSCAVCLHYQVKQNLSRSKLCFVLIIKYFNTNKHLTPCILQGYFTPWFETVFLLKGPEGWASVSVAIKLRSFWGLNSM